MSNDIIQRDDNEVICGFSEGNCDVRTLNTVGSQNRKLALYY